MSPLEAAKRLEEADLFDDGGNGAFKSVCVICDDNPHVPDCPWNSMPRIVAALEVVENILAEEDGEWCPHPCADRIMRALTIAMKGERD